MGVTSSFLNIDDIRITPEILTLISEIDEFKGAWKVLGELPQNRLSSIRRTATIESIGASTRIEGSLLSDRDVKRLLDNLEGKPLSTPSEQEVVGYGEVMGTIFQAWQDIPPTENHIKQFHRDLLRYSDKDERHRGEYKKLKNGVVAFEDGRELAPISETASPFDTPRLMTELVEWFEETERARSLHPLLLIAAFIAAFLQIHPFQDANGRLSRLLTTLLLLRAGYTFAPYSSLDAVVESRMEAYYQALCKTQGTIRSSCPKWEPWFAFFLRAVRQQVRKLIPRLEDLPVCAENISETANQIVDYVRQHGRATIGEIVKVSGVSRNTLKEQLRRLVETHNLVRRGSGKGSWYSLP